MSKFWKQVTPSGATTYGQGVLIPDGAAEMTEPAFYSDLSAATASSSPAAPAITFKADIYRRCTNEEADAIETALNALPTRQRRLFEESQYLSHGDESYTALSTAAVELFGQERADELLATS